MVFAMMRIAMMLILAISITTTLAYAEKQSVDIPFPPPYMLDCSYSVGEFLIFNCIWRSNMIPDEVQDAITNLETKTDILPPEEIEAGVKRIIIDWVTAPPPEPYVEPPPPRITVEDILKQKLDPAILVAVNKLAECERGYEGWAAFQEKSVYEVPDQFIWIHGQIRNDVLVKDLNLKYEECRIQRDYPLSATYLNKVTSDFLGLDRFLREPTHTFNQTTNFTRGSEIYKPLDAMDFLNAEKTATDFMCSDEGRARGLCVLEEFAGLNRGNPNPIIKDLNQYNQYINFKAGQIQTAQDYADTIADAKEAQCTVHYPIYKHRLGREGVGALPVWLEHCESIEDEFERTGIACYKGSNNQVLCSELRKSQDGE